MTRSRQSYDLQFGKVYDEKKENHFNQQFGILYAWEKKITVT
jgi:hypothetical protein